MPVIVRHKLQFRLAVVMILAGFALVAADMVGIWSARQDAMKSAWAESANLAGSLADQTAGVLQMMETVMTGIRDQVEAEGTSPASLARLNRMLVTAKKALPMLHGLFALDATGRPLVRAEPGLQPNFNYAGRAYFIHHRDTPGQAAFVGWPVRDAVDGSWVLTVSSRIDKPDGSFGGVVVASVSIGYLQTMFDGFDVGPRGVISMLRGDGVLIAQRPQDDRAIGQVAVKPLPTGQNEKITTVSALDGETRLLQDRRIGRLAVDGDVPRHRTGFGFGWADQPQPAAGCQHRGKRAVGRGVAADQCAACAIGGADCACQPLARDG
jgi:hypothetical protein